MAPITSFITLTHEYVLPIRVIVNRKAIASHHMAAEHAIPALATHSNKAIIRLRKATRIKLSNNDMRSLIDDIKQELLEICLERPIEELMSITQNQKKDKSNVDLNEFTMNKNRILISVTSPKGWRCILIVYVKALEALRQVLTSMEVPVPKGQRFSSGSANLLVRSVNFDRQNNRSTLSTKKTPTPPTVTIREESDEEDGIPDIIEQPGPNDKWGAKDEEEEEEEEEKKKKSVDVTYKAKKILTRGVDLIVLSRPRRV